MDETPPALPGGTVTFFFSDIEGSTRLAAALGDRFADALEAHRRIVRTALHDHRGVEVSTAGDSFFAAFQTARDAADAAVAVEAGLSMAGTEHPDFAIRVRIGLHTGQAVRVGHDYVGLDVHIAARISDAGHGGQVLVSDATRAALEALRSTSVPRLTDLGRHRLKDVGPQRVWQLEAAGTALRRFPALRSLEAHPSNLPVASTPLIDREPERADLTELIGRASIVTVTGAGGIGKSRVAVEVARAMVDRFPDGVFHLDLAGSPDATTVAGALLELLGPRSTPDADPRAALLDRLESRDLLLVLDTADRVTDLPGLVASIAARCPRIKVLLTSRSPLHVGAEVDYPLAPLQSDAGVELFNARASAVRVPAIDDQSRAAVATLVRRLDGIPLAIELAAARTRLFTPAALLDRLERRLPSLGQGALDLPDRQRTLHDTIDWSCQLLRPAEQEAFRELGVFAGSFDLAAVEAVVRPQDGEDAISLLESLVDRSLVGGVADAGGEPRFRLLAPIREFALDALRAEGREDEVRERHAGYWVEFAEARLDRGGQPSLEVIREIDSNEADIRAALEWSMATDARRLTFGLPLAGLLGRSWWIRGRVHEGIGWLDRALDQVDEAIAMAPDSRAAVARALFWTGVLLDDAGRPSDAARRLEACLELQREIADEIGIARTLNSLGVVARSLGDLDRAETLLHESIEQKRALGDRAGIPVSLSNLGVVASDRGRHDEAVDFMRQALAIDEELGGGSLVLVLARANLGASLVRAGKLSDGLGKLRLAAPGMEDLGDPELVVEILTSLAWIALATQTTDAARRAAGLLFSADSLRAHEGLPTRLADRSEADELVAGLSAWLEASELENLRAEAGSIDLDAGLALARAALAEAGTMPSA